MNKVNHIMKKNFWLITFALLISVSNNGHAQVDNEKKDTLKTAGTDPLKGLQKAGPNDLDPNITLSSDGVTIPFYSENLSLIQGEDLMELMLSGDYIPIPEPYIDSNKVVKAFVFHKATAPEQERTQMKEMPK